MVGRRDGVGKGKFGQHMRTYVCMLVSVCALGGVIWWLFSPPSFAGGIYLHSNVFFGDT